jgi:hypothetical protein
VLWTFELGIMRMRVDKIIMCSQFINYSDHTCRRIHDYLMGHAWLWHHLVQHVVSEWLTLSWMHFSCRYYDWLCFLFFFNSKKSWLWRDFLAKIGVMNKIFFHKPWRKKWVNFLHALVLIFTMTTWSSICFISYTSCLLLISYLNDFFIHQFHEQL